MEGEAACACEGSQGLGVPRGDLPLLLDEGGKLLHLRHPYRSLKVGHAVVEADHLVPVASLGIHAVVAEESEPVRERVVVSDAHPALARGDDLVAIEGEAAHSS